MLKLAVDEMSISFITDDDFHLDKIEDWNVLCYSFMTLLMRELKVLFEPEISKGNLPGYDITYNLGVSNPIKFGYHSVNVKSGMTLKFHAVALGKFLQSDDMTILEMLKVINSLSEDNELIMRVRRVDLVADYIDEDILEVDQVYKGLRNGCIEVLDCNENLNRSSINSFENNFKANTIYIGQKKTSERFLRIYNKKKEQIELGGVHYEEAKKAEQWIRFEVSYKKDLATQVGNELLKVKDLKELNSFIAGHITSKYQFYHNGKRMDFSSKLLKVVENPIVTPSLKYNKNGSLEKLKDYFKTGDSGFQGLLYQIRMLEGDQAMREYLNSVVEYQLNEYKPSQNIRDRVRKSSKEK